MRIIINESQYDQLSESKMRAWKYIDAINSISNDIINNKDNIINSNQWKSYEIGDNFTVWVANKILFASTYPQYKNAGGFMLNGNLIFYIKPYYTLKDVKTSILHELEHAIDYDGDNYSKVVNDKQQEIQNIAYAGVYNPQEKDDKVEQELERTVRYILYHYWVNTERNAFVAQSLMNFYTIEKQINDDIEALDWVAQTDANEHESFWLQMSKLLQNRKNGIDAGKLTPQNIKNHFVRQSYHKIKQYQNTVNKKLMYSKINNNGVATTTMKNVKTPPPPISEQHQRLNEIEAKDVNLSSFKVKKELNPKFWPNGKLNSRVRLRLMDIADDFVKELAVNWVKPKDVIFTGSIANYNWSRYSDVDLHILIDFKKVYPKNQEFVDDYFKAKKENWLANHEDLKIFGYPIEISVEDSNKDNPSSGRYSLYKNKWIVEPNDFQDAVINQETVKKRAAMFMTQIDDIEEKLNKEQDTHKCEKYGDKAYKIFDKLKKMRNEGLSSNKKEMSSGNIIYKIIRRTGYLDKIWEIINSSYDKVNSIEDKRIINEAQERGEKFSAGILPFRLNEKGNTEVFLGFPGQPKNKSFQPPQWMNRWSILKGHMKKGEDPLKCAVREFCEESGVSPKFISSNKLIALGTEKMEDRNIVCYGLDLTDDDNFDKTDFHSNLIDVPTYIELNGGKAYPEMEHYSWHEVDSLSGLSQCEMKFCKKCDEICQTRYDKPKPNKTVVKESLEAEMTAWHGSGANFDSFDHSFMNTGEGAQAHGWGTYVALNRNTGTYYARAMINGEVLSIGGQDFADKYLEDGRDHPAYTAYYALCDKGNIRNALNYIERIASYAEDEQMKMYWEQVIYILKHFKKSDFKLKRNHYLYEVDIPDNNGSNYIEEDELVPQFLWKMFVRRFRGENRVWAMGVKERHENDPEFTCREFVRLLGLSLDSPKKASQFLNKLGFVGIHYNGNADGECYVIFNEKDIRIINKTQL